MIKTIPLYAILIIVCTIITTITQNPPEELSNTEIPLSTYIVDSTKTATGIGGVGLQINAHLKEQAAKEAEKLKNIAHSKLIEATEAEQRLLFNAQQHQDRALIAIEQAKELEKQANIIKNIENITDPLERKKILIYQQGQGRLRRGSIIDIPKVSSNDLNAAQKEIQEAIKEATAAHKEAQSAVKVAENAKTNALTAIQAAEKAQKSATRAQLIELATGSLLEIIFDVYYEVADNKNYQAFINNSGIPLKVKITYHTSACSKDDLFTIPNNPALKYIVYPGLCQPKKITVYQDTTIIGERSLMIGQSGGRHGTWELIKGAQENTILIRQKESKYNPEYFQWLYNGLTIPIKAILEYRSLLCPNNDELIIQPNGTAEGSPKACLLKSITLKDIVTNTTLATYNIPIGNTAERHGNWHITGTNNAPLITNNTNTLNESENIANTISDISTKAGLVGGALGLASSAAGAAGITGALVSAATLGASFLMTTGALISIGVGIYYAVESDKNYQAFTNLTTNPLWIKIAYHLSKAEDMFLITPGDHRIVYPATDNKKSTISVLQPSLITVLDQSNTKELGSRSFNIGSDGGRHGDWQLVQGPTADSIVIKERTLKGALQNVQWVENTLNNTATVRFVYRSAFCPHDDVLTVAPGGNAQANPKGCLLKKIIADGDDKHFERTFNLAAPGTQHGNWRVTPFGIEGPL